MFGRVQVTSWKLAEASVEQGMKKGLVLGLGLWCLTLLSAIFRYIVEVSFIGGGNCNTQRKPPTCRQSLTNFIT